MRGRENYTGDFYDDCYDYDDVAGPVNLPEIDDDTDIFDELEELENEEFDDEEF